MFPDRDRCPFYGCVCWLSSCSDRETGREKGREEASAPSGMEEKLGKREAGK